MNLQTVDNNKLIQKQKLKKGKKITLKQTLQPVVRTSTQSYILADISGSMSGEKLDALKKALTEVWRPGIHGIAFGSEVYDFTEKDIQHLHTSGTTNMLDALFAAWDDSANHIILLTDGEPNQAKSIILDHVRQHSSIPIDTIGIGGQYDAYDKRFLRQISEITGGRFNSVDEPLLLSEIMSELLQISEKVQSTSGTIQL